MSVKAIIPYYLLAIIAVFLIAHASSSHSSSQGSDHSSSSRRIYFDRNADADSPRQLLATNSILDNNYIFRLQRYSRTRPRIVNNIYKATGRQNNNEIDRKSNENSGRGSSDNTRGEATTSTATISTEERDDSTPSTAGVFTASSPANKALISYSSSTTSSPTSSPTVSSQGWIVFAAYMNASCGGLPEYAFGYASGVCIQESYLKEPHAVAFSFIFNASSTDSYEVNFYSDAQCKDPLYLSGSVEDVVIEDNNSPDFDASHGINALAGGSYSCYPYNSSDSKDSSGGSSSRFAWDVWSGTNITTVRVYHAAGTDGLPYLGDSYIFETAFSNSSTGSSNCSSGSAVYFSTLGRNGYCRSFTNDSIHYSYGYDYPEVYLFSNTSYCNATKAAMVTNTTIPTTCAANTDLSSTSSISTEYANTNKSTFIVYSTYVLSPTPTQSPTQAPTAVPTPVPTPNPTHVPTQSPTLAPTSSKPTRIPSYIPTYRPTYASDVPTPSPTYTLVVVSRVVQTFSGLSYSEYIANIVAFEYGLEASVASTLSNTLGTPVSYQNITINNVTAAAASSSSSSSRKRRFLLASSSISVDYSINTLNVAASNVSTAIGAALTSASFTALLNSETGFTLVPYTPVVTVTSAVTNAPPSLAPTVEGTGNGLVFSSNLSLGGVIAIVLGTVIGIGLLGIALMFWLQRRQHRVSV